jgi:8-oxo-dGTP diphosphatase
MREVREETGLETSIGGYAGTTHYVVGGRPKFVMYFFMDVKRELPDGVSDRKEIESVEWVAPQVAMTELTHVEDRDLLAAVFDPPKQSRS